MTKVVQPRYKLSHVLKSAFRQTPNQVRGLWVLLLLSITWSVMCLGPRAFNIFDNSWLWGDLGQVYLAWSAYMEQESWALNTRAFSYPLTLSVSLFDPMPVMLIITKPIAWLLPDDAQYFGYYFTLCIILQGTFAYLAISEMLQLPHDSVEADRIRSVLIQLAGAVLILTAPYTLYRFMGHTALSSQWLIVLAIWVALRTRGSSNNVWYAANCGALFLATGFNPYIALMVGMSLASVAIWQANSKNWLQALLRIAALVGVGLVGLWLFGFTAGAGVNQGGFGIFSMNLLGPLDSNGVGTLLGLDVLDPTTGQSFEGFTYLGLGALLLLPVAALCLYRSRIDSQLPLWAGASVILAAIFMALSTRVTLSGAEFQYAMPDIYMELMARFRASGRFFWVAGFWLIMLALAIVVRRFGTNRSSIALAGLAFVQWVDVAGVAVNNNKAITSFQRLSLDLDTSYFPERPIEVVKTFPPWQCDHHGTPGGVRNYELIGYFALENKIVTNNFYAARTPHEQAAYHCDYAARLEELQQPGIYIFTNALFAEHQAKIEATLSCRPHAQLSGSMVCS